MVLEFKIKQRELNRMEKAILLVTKKGYCAGERERYLPGSEVEVISRHPFVEAITPEGYLMKLFGGEYKVI